MNKEILVAVDGSEQAEAAIDYVGGEYPQATLVFIHVIDPVEAGYTAGPSAVPGYSEEWYEESEAAAEDLFEAAIERAEAAGFAGDFETVTEVGRPARSIVEYADEADVDHIVLGSHGRSGVTRVLLGSVAETVVRRSPVPVTVVR
jgi:nucleotide-binding universal stress UspA family protein